jgi:hypothetical protein
MEIRQHNVEKHNLNTPFLQLANRILTQELMTRKKIPVKEQNPFLKNVCPTAAVLTCVPLPRDFQCPPTLLDIASKVLDESPECDEDEHIAIFKSKLSFNDFQLGELEKATRQQANSKTWRQQRIGCITATTMRDVFTKVNSLFSCSCCPDSPVTVEYKCPYKIRHTSIQESWQETVASWLMKPYPAKGATLTEQVFNYQLSRTRMTVENTFGRWKGRFIRFSKRVDMEVCNVTTIVTASCILHNLCEGQKNEFLPEWEEDEPYTNTMQGEYSNETNEGQAEDVRSALAEYFVSR